MVLNLSRWQTIGRPGSRGGGKRGLRLEGGTHRLQYLSRRPQTTMNDPEIQHAYEEQNRRDYIANAVFGSMVSIPLQLSCSVMDYKMYPEKGDSFLKVRLGVALLTGLVWVWFKSPWPCHRRIFGTTWFLGPLIMVLWMIYTLPDQFSPYYAGLNIILLAMGLISPWTYKQNLLITVFTLVMYVAVALARTTPQPL